MHGFTKTRPSNLQSPVSWLGLVQRQLPSFHIVPSAALAHWSLSCFTSDFTPLFLVCPHVSVWMILEGDPGIACDQHPHALNDLILPPGPYLWGQWCRFARSRRPIPSYGHHRYKSAAGYLYAVCSIAWVLFLSNAAAVEKPHRRRHLRVTIASMRFGWSKREHAAKRKGTGSDAAAVVTDALERRCAEVPEAYKLSPRESEILVLLWHKDARAPTSKKTRFGGKHREIPCSPHLHETRRARPPGHDRYRIGTLRERREEQGVEQPRSNISKETPSRRLATAASISLDVFARHVSVTASMRRRHRTEAWWRNGHVERPGDIGKRTVSIAAKRHVQLCALPASTVKHVTRTQG